MPGEASGVVCVPLSSVASVLGPLWLTGSFSGSEPGHCCGGAGVAASASSLKYRLLSCNEFLYQKEIDSYILYYVASCTVVI